MALTGKHVVFVVENLSVPFDRRVWREAKALKTAGFEVSVICPKGLNQDKESEITISEIEIYRYNIPFTQSSKIGYIEEYLKAFLATLILVIKINRKKKIDALHVANPPEIFFPLGWLGKILRYKFIFDHHDLSPESFLYKFKKDKNNDLYKLLLLFERLTFNTSAFVFTTNQSIKKIALERTGYSESKTAIVRNGPDKKFQPLQPNPNIKNCKKYLAAYIGVMGQTDGVENIIYSVGYIVKELKRKDVYFILIGYGDEYENHVKLINELGLEDFISMPGRLPDKEVLEILSTADVCLAPDPANGLNEYHTMNKIMDYMRCGKPIVSFDLLESRYSAVEAAVFVPNNNTIEYAVKILELLDKPEIRNKMGNYGKLRVENSLKWEYSEKVLIDSYLKIFNSK